MTWTNQMTSRPPHADEARAGQLQDLALISKRFAVSSANTASQSG